MANDIPLFPTLVRRLVKGTPLTHAEGDKNLDAISSWGNMIRGILGVALKSDGSLNDSVVDTGQLIDRSVTERKLGPISVFPTKIDTGSTNTLKISLTPAITEYADGQTFLVKVINSNTGPATLNVNNIGAVAIKKRGTADLEVGDYQGGSVVVLTYYANYFHLVSGVGGSTSSSGSAGGFSGFQVFEPADQAVPAAAASITFGHGFSQIPTDYVVSLIATDVDLTFAPGDVVDITQATDTSGIPAFGVKVDNANITVERFAATVDIAGYGSITTSKWLVRARASIKTNTATVLFPAVSVSTRDPKGAFANGDDLFIINQGVVGGNDHFVRVKLPTNVVTRLTNPASGPNPGICNAAPLARADGSQYIVFSSQAGFYSLALLEPTGTWQPQQLNAAAVGYTYYKPVHITDSGGITEVYVVPSSYGGPSYINNITLTKIVMATGVASLVGSAVDFTDAAILSADGTAGNVEFRAFNPNGGNTVPQFIQYNKTKKRIYIMTNESNLLHIFQINDSGFVTPGSILEWWTVVGRYGKLRYIKTISVAGVGLSSTTYGEAITIDIDLATGEERAIVVVRSGNQSVEGSVVRIPWRE